MKALVFIDHDIICRHFLNSGVLVPLVKAMETRFVFPDDGGKRMSLNPASLHLGALWERLPIDLVRLETWRWALFMDQLKLRSGDQERALRRFRRHSVGWKAAILLTLAGLPGIEPLFLTWIRRRLSQRPNVALSALFDREAPDVVIHPSVLDGFFINDIIDECRQRNIPSVVIMNSWDNPSTKRAVVGQPDWMLVWGAQTKAHAVRFVGMNPEHVVEIGAAQFDVFRLPPRIGRNELCARYGFALNRPIVLFAGANTQTDEFGTLAALDSAMAAGKLAPFNLLYRPHPWGGAGAGGERFLDQPLPNVRLDATMRDLLERVRKGDRSAITLPDYRDAHDLLSAVDIVVSPMSTIVVEAALHGKPVICFFPRSGDATHTIRTVPLYHFDEFFAVPDVAVARSDADLQAALAALADPPEIARRGTQLQEAASHFVRSFDSPWGERLLLFVNQLLQSRNNA